MYRINKIVEKIDVLLKLGEKNPVIKSIEFDSRKVSAGSLFVAVKGTSTDGHDYIGKAIEAGATAIICERIPEDPDTGISWIKTGDSARALGVASSAFFGDPSSRLKLVGVTGTNGKTTIATLLYRIFTRLGYRCGLFSTVCNYISGEQLPATHTTPDPVQLNSILSDMVRAGCDFAFMEVSSHAIDQQRIAGLKFEGGIFTNLTHDHLDYHKTFKNYLKAKKSFFDTLPRGAFALVNADDKNGRIMIQNCDAEKYTYSVRGVADYRCRVIEQDFNGMSLRINDDEVWTRFIGEFNASNLVAVYGAAMLLGAEHQDVLTAMSEMRSVAGRLESVDSPSGITGIVDYAHTPDALMNVIETINKIRAEGQSLITVVGAGGDRDRTKRPKMAAICAAGSSRVILTSDNPRTEDPDAIIDDMEAGVQVEFCRKVLRITSRHEAIKTAVMLAARGDIILVAGKGHENYQEIDGVRYHFDDREELLAALLSK
jgi:UDP-N-acetylmuramoyl-L-alanyl-D-glutamate--2,6-diaminopimelate ligase